MTTLHQALFKFWASLGLPVYLQGRTPDGAQFPFVSLNIGNPSGLNVTTLTAFVWLKDTGNGAYAERARFMDEVEKLIPIEGVLLEITGGYVEMYRNPGDFMSYYDDPDTDSNVIGARIAYRIIYYHV